MADDSYKMALDAARREMADLEGLKEQTEKRIAQLRQTIISLTTLSEEIDPADGNVYVPGAIEQANRFAVAGFMAAMAGRVMGFTDAVREVLKATGQAMSPTEVRDGLIRMGIDLEKRYTNPLAVVHSALNRLTEGGEVKQTEIKGKKFYRWITQNYGRQLAEAIAKEESEKKKTRAAGIKPRTGEKKN